MKRAPYWIILQNLSLPSEMIDQSKAVKKENMDRNTYQSS